MQVHAAVLLFGVAGLFGKFLALPPVVIVRGRVLFASLTLLLVSALPGLTIRPPSWHSLLGASSRRPTGRRLSQSVQESSVEVGLITYSTFPVFASFLEPLVFRERLRVADVLLPLVALAGIVVLLTGFDPGRAVGGGFGSYLRPAVAAQPRVRPPALQHHHLPTSAALVLRVAFRATMTAGDEVQG